MISYFLSSLRMKISHVFKNSHFAYILDAIHSFLLPPDSMMERDRDLEGTR